MKRLWLFLIISLLALLPFSPVGGYPGFGGRSGESPQISTERYILQTNPVFYLPLWKKDGTRIASDDVNGVACTTNSTWTQQGRDFSGANQNVVFATFDKANWTIEAWVYPHTITSSAASPWTNGIIGSRDASAADAVELALMNSNQVGWHVTRTGNTTRRQRTTDSPISANTWYHIVLTKAGDADVILYINTVVNATRADQTNTDLLFTNDTHLIGGAASGVNADWFDGLTGEVRVYNRILTPQEGQRNFIMTKWRYR